MLHPLLVDRLKSPVNAVDEVLLKHSLQPIERLSEGQRLSVIACKLVRSSLEKSLCLNLVELSRDILSDDFERQRRLSVLSFTHECLYVEILGQV